VYRVMLLVGGSKSDGGPVLAFFSVAAAHVARGRGPTGEDDIALAKEEGSTMASESWGLSSIASSGGLEEGSRVVNNSSKGQIMLLIA
jgi:hypothetical protein